MTKALRIFYRKSDEEIVWNSTLEGSGIFPRTIDEELANLPSIKPDRETPLGGNSKDYDCIEIQNTNVIDSYLASDGNTILNGQLQLGKPRETILPTPEPIRDLAKEIDDLKARIESLEKTTKV